MEEDLAVVTSERSGLEWKLKQRKSTNYYTDLHHYNYLNKNIFRLKYFKFCYVFVSVFVLTIKLARKRKSHHYTFNFKGCDKDGETTRQGKDRVGE